MNLHFDRQRNQRLRVTILIGLVVSLFSGLDTFAQDRVTVRDQRTGRTSTFRAQILDWDAERLVYETNERRNQVASSRIVRVDFSRTAEHVQARELLQQGRLPQAIQGLSQAIAGEPRAWVLREIRSEQIRAAFGMGKQREALTAFFEMIDSSPKSRFFHLIPLAWEKTQVDNSLIVGLRNWLKSENDIEKLVAASWLFHIDEQNALAALKELASSEDSRVAHLATAQGWRQKTVDVRQADVQLWQAGLQRMPEPLQAGGRFLIAAAQNRLAETSGLDELKQTAVVAFLQIPIIYPQQYQLSGSSLLQASQILASEGRQQEADIVKSELTGQFGFSSAALKTGGRVENLDR